VAVTYEIAGRLAQAVTEAASLAEANAALGALAVQTELDLEIEAAVEPLG
jgi:hypothetical protein